MPILPIPISCWPSLVKALTLPNILFLFKCLFGGLIQFLFWLLVSRRRTSKPSRKSENCGNATENMFTQMAWCLSHLLNWLWRHQSKGCTFKSASLSLSLYKLIFAVTNAWFAEKVKKIIISKYNHFHEDFFLRRSNQNKHRKHPSLVVKVSHWQI